MSSRPSSLPVTILLFLAMMCSAMATEEKAPDKKPTSSTSENIPRQKGETTARKLVPPKPEQLVEACKQGKLKDAEDLLDLGAEPNARFKDLTPLMWAAGNDHSKIVELLVGIRATLDLKDRHGMTALAYAAAGGQADTVNILLQSGADPRIVAKSTTIDTSMGARQLPCTSTIIMFAASNGHLEVVKMLLDSGVGVDSRNSVGVTALMHAAHKGNYGVAKLLLDKGADPNAQTKCGRTALMEACMMGATPVARLLIERGAKVNAKAIGRSQYTILNYTGNPNLSTEGLSIPLLFINATCENEHFDRAFTQTSLMIAAFGGRLELIKLLLQHGADVSYRNQSGMGALECAKKGWKMLQRSNRTQKSQYQEVIQLLKGRAK